LERHPRCFDWCHNRRHDNDGSVPYCFGNEAAKTEFMKDPKGNLAKAQSYYKSKHPG
jgi:hypothetical protein